MKYYWFGQGAAALLVFASSAIAAETPIAVSGIVTHPLTLSSADLHGFPVVSVSSTQVSGRGPVKLDCRGVSVKAILDKAVLTLGTGLNPSLSHTVLITADDGYQVALSMGELDPDYGNAGAIIATDCNGQPLDAPRLVVPHDGHGGRAVRGVVKIEVK